MYEGLCGVCKACMVHVHTSLSSCTLRQPSIHAMFLVWVKICVFGTDDGSRDVSHLAIPARSFCNIKQGTDITYSYWERMRGIHVHAQCTYMLKQMPLLTL